MYIGYGSDGSHVDNAIFVATANMKRLSVVLQLFLRLMQV